MSSTGSPRYGHLVEEHVREKKGLTEADDGRRWKDAETRSGTPVEIKGAMRERSNGSQGRFRLFYAPHRKLARQDGIYVFAVYEPQGNGINVLKTETMRARSLRAIDWSRSHHQTEGRDRQVKIPISTVFGR